jgi:hypothetical protein
MRKRRGRGRVSVGKLEGKSHLVEPGADGRIIYTLTEVRIFRKWSGGYGLDLASSGQEKVAHTYECGNKRSGSIKCGEFLD